MPSGVGSRGCSAKMGDSVSRPAGEYWADFVHGVNASVMPSSLTSEKMFSYGRQKPWIYGAGKAGRHTVHRDTEESERATSVACNQAAAPKRQWRHRYVLDTAKSAAPLPCARQAPQPVPGEHNSHPVPLPCSPLPLPMAHTPTSTGLFPLAVRQPATRPPTLSAASTSVTSWPALASACAAPSPAHPAPTTTTRLSAATGVPATAVAAAGTGFTGGGGGSGVAATAGTTGTAAGGTRPGGGGEPDGVAAGGVAPPRA